MEAPASSSAFARSFIHPPRRSTRPFCHGLSASHTWCKMPHCSVPQASRSPNSGPPSDARKSGAPNGRIQQATKELQTVAAPAFSNLAQTCRLDP
eukprot:5730931-Pyramimonas_sp.AAC.1